MKRKGDKIESVAKPIAKTIDYFLGTNVQNCGGCNRMRDNLNAGMNLAEAFYDRFWPSKEETKRKEK